MAPRILPEYGYDPSCGDFEVKARSVYNQLSDSASASIIKVEYSQFINDDTSFYSASLPWNGDQISVADTEKLLDAAKVPVFIQSVSAIDMIFKLVDQTLSERRQAGIDTTRLPSILVKISSDLETASWDSDMFENEDEDSSL